MRFGQISAVVSAILLTSAIPASAAPKVRRGPTSPRVFKTRTLPTPPRPKTHAQNIEPQRATQIQNALIQSHYLTGSPSGVWDQETQAAMEKLQADHGWQTKLVPDARAIIKLGLGSNQTSAAVAGTSQNDEIDSAPESAPVPASNR